MKKFIGLLLSAAICCTILTGCNSDSNNDTITQQSFTGCFAYVYDITNGVSAPYQQLGYTLRLNYSKMTADVTIANLRTPNGSQSTAYPTISISNIPWTIEKNGDFLISGRDLSASSDGMPVEFSSFTLRLKERVIDNVYEPGFCFQYTINKRFTVFSSSPGQTIWGTTTSTGTSGDEFSTTDTYYTFQFNIDTGRVQITMYNSKFISNMPPMDIVLENIPYVFDGGVARFDAETVIPKIGGTPYEGFPISDLTGELDFAKSLTMDFDCKPRTAPGSYHVNVKADYSIQ